MWLCFIASYIMHFSISLFIKEREVRACVRVFFFFIFLMNIVCLGSGVLMYP